MSTTISDAVHGVSPNADHLLTVAEVCEQTGYSEEWVRKSIRSGDLRAFQTGGKGGRIRVPLSAVYEWVGHNAARPDEPALEFVDWSEPAPDYDGNDFTVCDARTLHLPVHVSRLSEFFETKARAGL